MTTTVALRYIGAEERYFELPITGHQQGWHRNQINRVESAESLLLLATGLFEVVPDVVGSAPIVTVTGSPGTGNLLSTVLAAGYTGTPTYQWIRALAGATDFTGATNISGATSSTYTQALADEGRKVTCRVSGLTFIDATGVVVPVGPVVGVLPSTVTPPAIVGTPSVGTAVTFVPGSYAGTTPITKAIAWLLDGAVIVGETGATYTPITADIGKSLAVRETPSNVAGVGPAATSSVVTVAAANVAASASVRTRLNIGNGVSGANFVRTTRFRELAVVPVTNPWMEYWNGWVDTTTTDAAQEKVTGNVVPIAGAFLTNISGTGQNQSAATLTPVTWFQAASGAAGYAYKLDGTAGSGAEFSAAGGLISGDGLTLTVPTGWFVRSDSAVGVTLNGAYYVQWESAAPQGANYPAQPVPGGRVALGDLNKDATVRSGVFIKDWTSLTGVATGSAQVGPNAIYGYAASGVVTVGVAGDSIFNDNFDRDVGAEYGDADGATGLASRALKAAGYPSVRTAVSGAQARVPQAFGGYAIRKLSMRFCSAAITDMGHNDRGYTWSLLQTYLRHHWTQLRTGCKGGNGRVIASTWCPLSTSTDNWATKANQTPTMIAGNVGYDTYNPFIRAGAFVPASGDPDAGYDLYAAIYSGARAAGATDWSDTYWPTNGTARTFNNDSTHPAQLVHSYVAADLIPKLPQLLRSNPDGSVALPILRSVSTASAIATGTATKTGTRLGTATKDLHYIGSGAVKRLRIVINNWSLSQKLNTQPFDVKEMWLTVSGQTSGFAVKWSGASFVTVPAGAHRFASDWIYPSDVPGLSTTFPRGTAFYLGSRVECASGAGIPSKLDRNPTTNSSIAYAPGGSTISNLQGSSPMTWSGDIAAIGDAGFVVVVEGEFEAWDQKVICGIGDSITDGLNESDRSGFYYRGLFDDYSAKSNPIAGLLIALVGSNASLWADPAIGPLLADVTRLANLFFERYGINTLTTSGGQALANQIIADRRVIWSAIRASALAGGRKPIISALEMTPRTSGTWTTLAGQTPTPGCGLGESLDLLHTSLAGLAGQSNGPDQYIDIAQDVRGDTVRTNLDYFKWSVSPAATTDDGLHPITAAHVLMATRSRAWIQSTF